MISRVTVLVLIGLIWVLPSWAGDVPSEEASKPITATPGILDFKHAQSAFRGLFDPARFSMSHTLGMEFQSGPFGGNSQYYLNTITYRFSPKLTGFAQVGVQNTMGGTPAFRSSSTGARLVVPNLGLLYEPSSNLRIEFRMSQGPSYGYYRGYDPFYRPYFPQ